MKNLYIKDKEAQNLYQSILDGFKEQNNLVDKANSLRSIFDVVLSTIINNKYNGLPPLDIVSGFQGKIGNLFEAGSEEYIELNKIRLKFNRIQHPHSVTCKNSFKRKGTLPYFSLKDYKYCLKGITNLVYAFSSVQIPPELSQARKELKYKRMKYQLEIIMVIELFDSLAHIGRGQFILNKLEEMIKEKDRLGLDMLKIHLVTYSPSINYLSPFSTKSNLEKARPLIIQDNPVNEALRKSLSIIDQAINNWIAQKGKTDDKPWLMWLSQKLDNNIEKNIIEKIASLRDAEVIGFSPFALDSISVIKKFEELIPKCGPKNLDPYLIENFFSSILETIQEMHKPSLIKLK